MEFRGWRSEDGDRIRMRRGLCFWSGEATGPPIVCFISFCCSASYRTVLKRIFGIRNQSFPVLQLSHSSVADMTRC